MLWLCSLEKSVHMEWLRRFGLYCHESSFNLRLLELSSIYFLAVTKNYNACANWSIMLVEHNKMKFSTCYNFSWSKRSFKYKIWLLQKAGFFKRHKHIPTSKSIVYLVSCRCCHWERFTCKLPRELFIIVLYINIKWIKGICDQMFLCYWILEPAQWEN